ISQPRPVLDTLVRRSLVRFLEGHYTLRPIVRDYAESKLLEAGVNVFELHKRAITYYQGIKTLQADVIASDYMFELAVRFGSPEDGDEFIRYVMGFYRELIVLGYLKIAEQKKDQIIVV